MMKFKTIEELKENGFIGFKSMKALFNDYSMISLSKGVYMILRIDRNEPNFLEVGSGGHFKGRNPNVPINKLNDEWVNDTIVVYIGKAGKDGSRATLQSRLKQYFIFGQGGNVGHWGGRYIWQLNKSDDLLVCWKPVQNDDPAIVESDLIRDFKLRYGKRPFANLKD
ncbi:hypothetical protein SAMN05444405_106106 [Bacteroides luti]|uniref:GIY-YIG domain-containing protein n=1 Tax=Bacteroides luti TaxID=1297750 RepID=A0A1M5A092_9BACE|nr:hypothetical protein [Bacteroides luti]SHF23634.1 hypothetical protein SAMN05444405_106106 [Bacteroides luti]